MSDASKGNCASGSIAAPPVSYIEESNPDVQRRVRARFKRDIATLAALGFRELAFYREQFGLFSTMLSVPMSVAMFLKREVMGLEKGLQVNACFVLMYHNQPATVSVPLALGVKMYTGFTDRTVLISSNFPSCAVSNEALGVLRNSSKAAIADAWAAHQQQVRALEADGKQTHRSVGFDYYVEVSRQEEKAFG